MALLALAFLLMARPSRTSPSPPPRNSSTPALKARADALRDAVADMSVSDVAIKTQAQGFFDQLPNRQLIVAVGKLPPHGP